MKYCAGLTRLFLGQLRSWTYFLVFSCGFFFFFFCLTNVKICYLETLLLSFAGPEPAKSQFCCHPELKSESRVMDLESWLVWMCKTSRYPPGNCKSLGTVVLSHLSNCAYISSTWTNSVALTQRCLCCSLGGVLQSSAVLIVCQFAQFLTILHNKELNYIDKCTYKEENKHQIKSVESSHNWVMKFLPGWSLQIIFVS